MTWHRPRMTGKSIVQRVIIDGMLRRGEHVHTASRHSGEICNGGDSECSLWAAQLDEAMEAWGD